MRRNPSGTLSPSVQRTGLLLLAGLIHTLAFAPGPLPAWALPFVQLLTLSVLCIHVWRSAGPRQAAWSGFAFGLGNFALGLYWLHTSMHVYGGMPWALAAVAVLLLAAFEALFIASASALSYWLGRPSHIAPSPERPQSPGRLRRLALFLPPLLWACAWTAAEWLRGTLFTGFPWLNIGYAHVDGYLAGWAPVLGTYGVAWLAAYSAGALAALYLQSDGKDARNGLPPFALAALLGIGGLLLAQVRWYSDHGEPMVVRLVQGNIPQSQKFDPLLIQQGMNTYHHLASLPPRQESHVPDLIVLPETVIPMPQDRLPAEQWQRWLDIAAASDATLMLGVPLHDRSQGIDRYTNSVIAFDGGSTPDELQQGQTAMRYDKHHLVPFGEFIPPGFRWFVETMQIPLGDFARGELRQELFPIKGQVVAPNICYEDVFGEEILHAVRPSETLGPGASLLINLSNLAWFGDSWALRQHLQIARMRSLETARPMLRATNTGATAVIAPDGAVRMALPAMTPGVIDAEVQGTQGLTPYVRAGNLPILLLSWGMLAALLARRLRARSRQGAPFS